ncbi:MAG: hypothetical protein IKF22_06690 [Lachnospiraceae bacterium]|nr:hypothetical protein [Lachnospiraceae bacterium]
MKKKMPAIIAAACAAALIGCGAGGSSVDPYDGSDTDSFYTESDHMESNPAGSSLDENDTISQIVPIVPPDTESVAASEEFRSFLNWEEDTSDGKVYNIFCGDEEFMRIVARYCDTYEAEDAMERAALDNGETDGETDSQSTESGEEEPSETIYYGRIGTAEIRWIICHDIGERYLTNLDLSLIDESDPNNVTDLYIVDAVDVQKYVDPEVQAAMPLIRDAGLPTSDLSAQYAYTEVMGSGDDGVQRAVSYGISPGVFMYDREAAASVLGSDDPEVVQKAVADWEAFADVAARANEKGFAMLPDWTNSFDAFAVGVSGDWLTETGGVKIDTALREWTEQSELFMEQGYFSRGERPCFGRFISADEVMDLALSASEDNSTGKYGICAGPAGWYRGGSFIVVNSLCDQRSLTKKLLEEIVFDRDVLRGIKAEGIIPNSRIVLPEKSESPKGDSSAAPDIDAEASGESGAEGPEENDTKAPVSGAEGPEENDTKAPVSGAERPEETDTKAPDSGDEKPEGADAEEADGRGDAVEVVTEFLGGQDPYQVFAEAAERVSLSNVSVFDAYLCDMYRREFSAYFAGEKDKDAAMRVFYTEASDLISEEE